MELFSIIGHFLLLWVFIYLTVFILQCLSTKNPAPRRSSPQGLLPTFSITHSTEIERDQWSIQLFQVKYTTQRLNPFFYRLTDLAPRFWKVWFHLGAIAASITMIVGMIVIAFAALKILSSFNTSSTHAKREWTDKEQVFLPMVNYKLFSSVIFILKKKVDRYPESHSPCPISDITC